MDLIINSQRPTANFTIVPNELITDERLSAEARLVLIYVLSKPNGWTVRRDDIQTALHLSSHVWKRVSKELRATNQLTLQIVRCAKTGIAKGRQLVFGYISKPRSHNHSEKPTPETEAQDHRKDGFPTFGKTTRSRVEKRPEVGSVFAPTSKKDILRTTPPIKHSTQSRATAPEEKNAKMGKKAKTAAKEQTRLKRPAQTTTTNAQIEQLAQYQNWLAENKGASYSEYLFWRGTTSNAST